jgi:TPP-dependent pyruvate/acetoin dehydrogenase alpha subunit
MGKETGYCKGRGGSMHIADVRLGILGANGVVGAGIPIAVGAALAVKYRKGKQVVLCFFGDGATSTGAFHEAVNMGAIWRLPVIFICENNLYAITTPISKSCALNDVAGRANGYGFPGVVVQGNDVLAVREATLKAVERARRGDGPTMIECKTYRWSGHHLGDDGKYRDPEEVQSWKERCPIITFSRHLLKKKLLTEEGLKKIKAEVDREIGAAVQFAMDGPSANPDKILDDVYYYGSNLAARERGI